MGKIITDLNGHTSYMYNRVVLWRTKLICGGKLTAQHGTPCHLVYCRRVLFICVVIKNKQSTDQVRSIQECELSTPRSVGFFIVRCTAACVLSVINSRYVTPRRENVSEICHEMRRRKRCCEYTTEYSLSKGGQAFGEDSKRAGLLLKTQCWCL